MAALFVYRSEQRSGGMPTRLWSWQVLGAMVRDRGGWTLAIIKDGLVGTGEFKDVSLV